jgi:hypothetical protein
MEQTDDKYQELLESYETCREGGMSAEREAEIRETIRLMRARLAEFNVTQPATRLSLAMAEDLLAAFDEAREALDEALAEVARREREHEALLETAQKALAHAEVEMLRGVRCAEERGAKWALARHGNPFASKTLEQYAAEICRDARGKP